MKKRSLFRYLKNQAPFVFKRSQKVAAGTTVDSAHTPPVITPAQSESAGGNVNKLWKSILEKAELFASLSKNMDEVHPWAQKAYSALASVGDPKHQEEQRTVMASLLITIDGLYALVINTDWDNRLYKYRKALLKDMSLQMTECAHYIHLEMEYTEFWNRAGSPVEQGSQRYSIISEFNEGFVKLREDISQGTALEAQIHEHFLIAASGVDLSRACLNGTRVEILDQLQSWVDTPTDTARVFFLLGGAGMGKSAIAHSIGVQYAIRHGLGSFISIDPDLRQHPVTSVIRTIAHKLAHWNREFRDALALVLHDKGHLAHTNDISEQWEGLIVEPLGKIHWAEPVLVVIDAFDACGPPDAEDRRVLLKHLTEGSRLLPGHFRILITSRPEHDVMMTIECNHQHITHLNLDSQVSDPSDIELYVRWQLSLSLNHNKRLDDEAVQLLVRDTQGLFQWAAMACRAIVISPDGLRLKRPSDWHDIIYREILKDLFAPDYPIDRFRSVMTALFCAPSPVSIDALDHIHRLASPDAKDDEVRCVVERMGTLLSGIYTRTTPIHLLHSSLRDFLTSADRSGKWFIDVASGHQVMALACFRLMNKLLSFNMCGLEMSSVLNRDIPDLDNRVSESIPQSLLYAACNWQGHLPSTLVPSALQRELERFLQEKLLFWFELLSLLKALNRAAPCLEAALAVYRGSSAESCQELLHDAILFIRHFAAMIELSAVHVYISALPFSPPSSVIRRTYLPHFPGLAVVEGINKHWTQTCAILSGHTNRVNAVVYSPDNRRIASGSRDGTVRIWDAETSVIIHCLPGRSRVQHITFSPDCYHVAAACADARVRVWDSATGDAVCEFGEGHGSAVNCVAYSPHGNLMVSGDDDGCICIWSTETRSTIHQLAHGDRIFHIAFSPSGRYLTSGGRGGRILVWDASNGQAVGYPLEGHEHNRWVRSVLFSADGSKIISGSDDATIRIWDFATQQMLHTISHPLLGDVMSLSLSPDGSRLVSGSRNQIILIWDVQEQRLLGGPLVGHSAGVISVSFSPNGHRIVSGSFDRTVRIWSADANSTASQDVSPKPKVNCCTFSPDGRHILSGNEDGSFDVWDANTGDLIRAHCKAHSEEINCIDFSPDGSRFVTASHDGTLRIWHSQTLQPLGDPLRGHERPVIGAYFSPDGYRIVSCSYDSTLRIWDAQTRSLLLAPFLAQQWVRSLAWSPTGKHIAAASGRTVYVRDAETGSAVSKPLNVHKDIRSVSWSSESQHLMASSEDGTIRFWDLRNWVGPAGQQMDCHQGMVYCASYSPDGRHIVSVGGDGLVRMWNSQTREPVGIPLSYPFASDLSFLILENEPRPSLAFSRDGRRLIWRLDQLVLVWDMIAFTEPGVHPSFKNLKNPLERSAYTKDTSTGTWDGWIRGANGSLVMWVPHEYRESVLWHGMAMVLGRKVLTIDFTNACYGPDWDKCYGSVASE